MIAAELICNQYLSSAGHLKSPGAALSLWGRGVAGGWGGGEGAVEINYCLIPLQGPRYRYGSVNNSAIAAGKKATDGTQCKLITASVIR
ncbi:unnamed protein product, partial [Iphiclides podalirius]